MEDKMTSIVGTKAQLVGALEELIIAADAYTETYSSILNSALYNAKEVLGYDPVRQEQNYSVVLRIDVDAFDPEAAVQQYIDLISSDDEVWEYEVTDENGVVTLVDTYNWDRSK